MAQPPRPGIMRPPQFGFNFGNMGGRPLRPGQPQGPRPQVPQPGPQPRRAGFYMPQPDSDSDAASEANRREQDRDADRRRLEHLLAEQELRLREQEDQLRLRQQELDRRQADLDAHQQRAHNDSNNLRSQQHRADTQFTRDYFTNNRQQSPERNETRRRRPASLDSTISRDTEDSLADRFRTGMDINRSVPTPDFVLPPPLRMDTKVHFLPPAQQHMQDLEQQTADLNRKLQFDKLQVEVLERTNTRLALGLDDKVAMAKKFFEENESIVRQKEMAIKRAKTLSQKFKVSIKQPVILPAPRDFERSWGLMTAKNIRAAIPTFNPSDKYPKDFHDVWNAILQHGRGEYLQEEHYMRILGIVLQGDAGRTFSDLEEAGNNLHYILETLAELFATKRTLIEDQKAVDDFTRFKDEPLTTAMRRCNVMVQRLHPLHDEYSWPDTRQRLMRGVLKQILSSKTRKHLDMQEATAIEEGTHMNIQALISVADLYERCNDEVPKKDSQTLFQTASGHPKVWVQDQLENHQNQIKALKLEHSQTKTREKSLTDALQVASAVMKKHSSEDKKKDALHKVQLQDRAASKERRDKQMTDVEMTNLPVFVNRTPKPFSSSPSSTNSDKNYRADKNQKERGRSKERRDTGGRSSTPFQQRTPSQSSQGARSTSRSQSRSGSQSNNRSRQPGSRSSSTHSSSGRPDTQVFISKGVSYFVCHASDFPHNVKVGEACTTCKPEN